MALSAIRHLLTVTIKNLVPIVRFGIRPFNFTFQFLSTPLRALFVSSASSVVEVRSLHFRRPKPMELKGRIIVYSILGCPHCMRAKNTLQDFDLPYTDVRLDIFPKEVREQLKAKTGKSSVPQIFFNEHHIGGNEDLQTLVKENKARFDELIAELACNPPPKDAPQPPDPKTAIESGDPGEFVCEPDEYSQMVMELKKSGLIKDHKKGLTTIKKSFSGKEFVDWIVKTKGLATQVGEDLRKLILKLHAAFLSKDGKKVDYKGIANSGEFQAYIRLAQELQRVDLEDCSRNEKLAFFVNIYNALVIHANVARGPPVNLWQRYKFFNTMKYIIGGYEYSLQDIENGVLRANRKGVGMLTKPFSKNDPRLNITLETAEPLIHFGLVCGAKSCPPIKTYTSDEVIEQLKLAAEAFLDGPDGCDIDVGKNTILLSMIFKWYQEDFGGNDEATVLWVFQRLEDGEKKKKLRQLIDKKKYKVKYLKYDWSVNAK
ncbi:uncharacterized protein [Littorina saxatilis]|uniref:uncharacterized protein isoform X2 n=1 Tax=Littorina saxatilis TaxID=31220 RepID=UPI0038B661F7